MTDAPQWPQGCHSANSCHRNMRCMYVPCVHSGRVITDADIAAALRDFDKTLREAQQPAGPEIEAATQDLWDWYAR